MSLDFSKIKLVIWDLDDTFWSGTLSEGTILPIEENIKLIKDLTSRGIINSICSKNDKAPVETKLCELGLLDYFVFTSIDWTPKGPRINKLISDMGLRPENCLFIDDNVVNLNEAKYYSEKLMIMEPTQISGLVEYFNQVAETDRGHNRLMQYKVLEQKQIARAAVGNNIDFLYASNTEVKIHKNCLEQIDRIYELINRTNQLNFTKCRCTKDELYDILTNDNIESGYVTVCDNFGDYGIVGFYALYSGELIHFLFSCRTIGQGVEQWVYSKLGWPKLNVVGTVVNTVEKIDPPAWINQQISKQINSESKLDAKIVFKGACDLQILAGFLKSSMIVEEFTYVGQKRANSIEHHNHSVNILSYPFKSDKERKEILDRYVFADEEMFNTSLFDKDVSIAFLSTQIEPNLGIYKNKETGDIFAFGEYSYPLTDKRHWVAYERSEIFTSGNSFTEEWLEKFSSTHEFLGRLTPEQIIDNYKKILTLINPNSKLCLILGSEMPYEKNEQIAYQDRHIFYQELNKLLREYAKQESRIYLLDLNNYIHSQDDFLDNINHYQRSIYYEASKGANDIISNATNLTVRNKNKITLYTWILIRKFKDIVKILLKLISNK